MNARIAERLGGTLLLRFEDIDTARCRPEYREAALEDLAWLGIRWQEPVWRQSERFPVYAAALERLKARGLVYPCFCSRGDVARAIAGRTDWPHDPDGSPLYPGTCRTLAPAARSDRIAAGERPVWRLAMAQALKLIPEKLQWLEFGESDVPIRVDAQPAVWGDVTLVRRDTPASYHLAVVVDDAAQCITDVVRGEDLRAATNLHSVLQSLLGHVRPAYHHHRLIAGRDGHKLSKSRAATPLRGLPRLDLEGCRFIDGLSVVARTGSS